MKNTRVNVINFIIEEVQELGMMNDPDKFIESISELIYHLTEWIAPDEKDYNVTVIKT
jgi:hypothetical protein